MYVGPPPGEALFLPAWFPGANRAHRCGSGPTYRRKEERLKEGIKRERTRKVQKEMFKGSSVRISTDLLRSVVKREKKKEGRKDEGSNRKR